MIDLEMYDSDIPVEIELETEVVICEGCGSDYPFYEGDYNIIPETSEQILPTKNTVMKRDLVVSKIPTYEIQNESGTTFIIGEMI